MPLSTDFLNNPRTFCWTHVVRMPGSGIMNIPAHGDPDQ